MAKIAQYNTSGYYANTYRHKGGYSTNSPTLETETTIEPVVNNTDSSKYVIYVANSENKKAYNSACLSYGEHFYFLCLLPSDGYISGWEGNNRYYVDHLTLNNSLYSNINNQMGQETKDGVTYYIPYNRNFGKTVITESIESDIPVFYDPEEFLDYVNNPYTPPVTTSVSGGGGGFYGGYKGVIS